MAVRPRTAAPGRLNCSPPTAVPSVHRWTTVAYTLRTSIRGTPSPRALTGTLPAVHRCTSDSIDHSVQTSRATVGPGRLIRADRPWTTLAVARRTDLGPPTWNPRLYTFWYFRALCLGGPTAVPLRTPWCTGPLLSIRVVPGRYWLPWPPDHAGHCRTTTGCCRSCVMD